MCYKCAQLHEHFVFVRHGCWGFLVFGLFVVRVDQGRGSRVETNILGAWSNHLCLIVREKV